MALVFPKDKRAVFFSFLALTLVSILLVLYSSAPEVSTETMSIDSRFQVFDTTCRDLSGGYVNQILKTQGSLAVRSMLDRIQATKQKINDVNASFEELVRSGSINGVSMPLMKQNISDYADDYAELARENFGLNVTIEFYDLFLEQTDPWHLTLGADVYLRVSRTGMFYSSNTTYASNISIIGLKDPVYLFAGEENTIGDRGTLSGWMATTDEIGPDAVLLMLEEGSYWHTSISPSFLMRLSNNTGQSDCCGIESLVDSSYGNFDRSYVDYLFFNNKGCPASNFTGISDTAPAVGFKLDNARISVYNLTDVVDNGVC